MKNTFDLMFGEFYKDNILSYIESLKNSPLHIIVLIIDLILVSFLVYAVVKILRNTRAWQLLKGIAFLIIATALSSLFGFKILNYILTSFMTYGVILLIIIFQPELRRALEQLRKQ